MKVSVKINTKNASKIPNCKAFVSVTLDNTIAINGLKLMDGKNGMWLTFPSYKMGNEYKDYVYPLSKDARKALTDKVVQAYNDIMSNANAEPIPFE